MLAIELECDRHRVKQIHEIIALSRLSLEVEGWGEIKNKLLSGSIQLNKSFTNNLAQLMAHKKDSQDVRAALIEKIWKYGTGMLAISAIFGIVRGNNVVPVVVASGASVSTMVIWCASDKRERASSLEIKKLQQRIADLETIASSDVLHNRFQQLEQNRSDNNHS